MSCFRQNETNAGEYRSEGGHGRRTETQDRAARYRAERGRDIDS